MRPCTALHILSVLLACGTTGMNGRTQDHPAATPPASRPAIPEVRPDATKNTRPTTNPARTPPELGTIKWRRDFDRALDEARRTRRPILVLFQEVPGCATCVDYGAQVLSHPLIVEAAETLFIPAAVYNNVPGDDERVLKSFEEKAWNNPVVRIIAADRAELASRVAEDYTVDGLAVAMLGALEKARRPAPQYLRLLAEEGAARRRGVETATFAMHCFWEGEAAFGRITGVVRTRPGFRGDHEVVEVTFDPRVLPFDKLARLAQEARCATRVYCHDEGQRSVAEAVVGEAVEMAEGELRPDDQPKYYLSKTPLRFLPMTPAQACRTNAALHRKTDAYQFLSPRQIELLETIESAPAAGWRVAIDAADLVAAWTDARAIADRIGTAPSRRTGP